MTHEAKYHTILSHAIPLAIHIAPPDGYHAIVDEQMIIKCIAYTIFNVLQWLNRPSHGRRCLMVPHSAHCSLGPPEPTLWTISLSVQQFLQGSRSSSSAGCSCCCESRRRTHQSEKTHATIAVLTFVTYLFLLSPFVGMLWFLWSCKEVVVIFDLKLRLFGMISRSFSINAFMYVL